MKYIVLLLFLSPCHFGQARSPAKLSKVEDSVWVHTTYKLYYNVNLPSNGLIIQTSVGLVLIDTPWDDSLTIELLDSAKKRFNQDVVFASLLMRTMTESEVSARSTRKESKSSVLLLRVRKRKSLALKFRSRYHPRIRHSLWDMNVRNSSILWDVTTNERWQS